MADSGKLGNVDDFEETNDVEASITTPSSSLKTQNSRKTGFDCEFIEKPKEVVTDCPVCLQVLREPHQATCCGNVFCRVCIQHVKESGKRCPTCNQTNFQIFPDKSHHKHLYSFKVWCCNRSQGCNWSGELGQLAAHLNDEYNEVSKSEGCDYTQVDCIYCSEYVARMSMKKHTTSECPLRPYTCPICKIYKGTYKQVEEEHHAKCINEIIPCPNGCGVELERGEVEAHLNANCSIEVIPCDFASAGCMEKVLPHKLEEHLASNIFAHLSLLGSAHSDTRERFMQLQSNLNDNNTYLDSLVYENKQLKSDLKLALDTIQFLSREVEELKTLQQQDREAIEALQSSSSILPVTITLEEYEKRKSKGDMGWTSTPFYTHPKGYQMCLWVDVGGNGQGKGIYISVFLSLLKGEYDSNLSWPFKGSIMIQLLNQVDRKCHHREVIKYHDSTPRASAGRVMDEGRKAKPWGKGKFIRHEEIQHGFVLNDSIKFCVTKLS